MNHADVLKTGRKILRDAKLPQDEITSLNFLQFADKVLWVVREKWSHWQRNPGNKPWLKEFVVGLKQLQGDFEKVVAADPMILYRAINDTVRAFHQSKAFIRYNRSANRTGKTQSGYAEDYFCATGHHPWRPWIKTQASVLICAGVPFSNYVERVFNKKMITGEEGNTVSPLFPEGGKWLYKYNSKDHIITLRCKECAETRKPGLCESHHLKPTIALVSKENSVRVVEAFTVRLAHGDEEIPEEFYHAMKMRVADQDHNGMIFTGTPLAGLNSWENRLLAERAQGPVEENRIYPDREDSPPLVELFGCGMVSGNIVKPDEISKLAADMDEFEKEARLYGRPTSLAKNPVFDRKVLQEMRKECSEPVHCALGSGDLTIEMLAVPEEVTVTEVEDLPKVWTGWRVWERPEEDGQYLISADTAAGLTRGDPSCADIWKLTASPDGHCRIRQVAQFHGWIGVFDYADELKKGALWYNSAQVAIELTGNLGRAVMLRMRQHLHYWNLYRDYTKPELVDANVDANYGTDTSANTKPMMVGALQQYVQERLLTVRSIDTINELVAYEQVRETADGKALVTPKYRGAGGSHDDRVMSAAVGVYVAVTQPPYDFT